MALTTRQLLLLNNLMYMPDCPPLCNINGNFGPDTTVGEIVDLILINIDQLANRDDSGELITNQEWIDLLEAIRSDDHLRQVVLITTHEDTLDGGGGGESALFVDPSDNEAVVVFQGTAAHEWKDDFLGGAKTHTRDGVSTIQQEHALEWFQGLDLEQYSSVTVTGHSKGGNKAKYITILDDSVTRCISFDGQGFSDDFMHTYSDQIFRNQEKISNHNGDYDYVNLILNDIGDTHFYEHNNISDGGFFENHCPNSYFHSDNGSLIMKEVPRPHEMEVMDQYLNSMLRSIPEDKREEYLGIIGETVELALGAGDAQGAVEYLLRPEHSECAGYVIGYTAAYIRDHPDAADSIRSVMDTFDLDAFLIFSYPIELLLHDETLISIIGLAGGGAALSAEALKWLRGALEKLGIPTKDLNEDTIIAIASILFHASGTCRTADTHISGRDLVIPGVSAGIARFSVSPGRLETASGQLRASAARIADISEELDAVVSQFSGLLRVLLYFKVVRRVETIRGQSAACEQLAGVLDACLNAYRDTELQVMNQF